jgi:hypothetical protein
MRVVEGGICSCEESDKKYRIYPGIGALAVALCKNTTPQSEDV